MKKSFKIILITVSVLVVLTFLYLIKDGFIKEDLLKDGQKVTIDSKDNEIQNINNIKERVPSRFACVGEYCDGSMSGDDYLEKYTVLKIPLIKEVGNIGCGVGIFFAPHTTDKTDAILDATYKLLFDIKQWPEIKEDGFRNTVAAFSKTYYDHVVLEKDGTARVYLLGQMNSPGTCADPEFKAQIEQVAFQFNTVKKIEVYLNNKLFDWCVLDLSDGEGFCKDGPRYWITSK